MVFRFFRKRSKIISSEKNGDDAVFKESGFSESDPFSSTRFQSGRTDVYVICRPGILARSVGLLGEPLEQATEQIVAFHVKPQCAIDIYISRGANWIFYDAVNVMFWMIPGIRGLKLRSELLSKWEPHGHSPG